MAPPWSVRVTATLGLVSLALFAALVAASISLIETGAVFGWMLPAGIPIWGGILMLVVIFQILTGPVRALRHASYSPWGRPHAWFAVWDGLVATGMTMLIVWLLYTHMPPPHDFREFLHNIPAAIKALAADARAWARQIADAFGE